MLLNNIVRVFVVLEFLLIVKVYKGYMLYRKYIKVWDLIIIILLNFIKICYVKNVNCMYVYM